MKNTSLLVLCLMLLGQISPLAANPLSTAVYYIKYGMGRRPQAPQTPTATPTPEEQRREYLRGVRDGVLIGAGIAAVLCFAWRNQKGQS